MSGTYIAVMTLTVTEEVRGDLADVNKDFTFSIYVSSDDTSINYTLPYFGSKTGDLVFIKKMKYKRVVS